MGLQIRRCLVAAISLALLSAAPLLAQAGSITGRLTDADGGQPITAALVEALNAEGRVAGSAVANQDGRYRITGLAPGSYTLSVSAVGYGTQRLQTVQVSANTAATADLVVKPVAFELNPMVVSVGRTAEKANEAPAHVEVVSEREIRARPAITPADHLRSVPAVDIITQGVQSTNVVVRGFNNIFSGALHVLTDNRIASVPSLRVNVLNFIPVTNEDIERMEIVLGPGSALYGPNTANGVLHMLTFSPLTNPGTNLSITGGQQSVLHFSGRTAHRVSENFGLKVSGQYMRANEFEDADSVEVAERAKFASDPVFWKADLMRAAGVDGAEADRRIARLAARDFDITRWSGDVRGDWRVTPDATAVFAAGVSSADQIELTGLGAGQAQDWRTIYYQGRFNWNRLFAQAYVNQSDAGDTFLLRNGAPIVDKSKLYVGQLQHGMTLMNRHKLTYGIDYLFTDPETNGTINGQYEPDDETSEFGAYLQTETQITSKIDLVLAGRIDTHSALPDAVFSPRAALVIKPVQEHAFRLTYNRAFSTPSSLNQFLDLGTAIPIASAARLGYSVRVQGTGENGFSFRQADGSYLMRSPFTPAGLGGPAMLLPASAVAFWTAAVQVFAAQAAAMGTPVATPMVQFLLAQTPTPAQISSNFLVPTTQTVGPLSSLDLDDIEPIRESTQSVFEVGYKGVIAQRLLLSADAWHMERENDVTPLTVMTPLLLMNGPQIAAFLVPRFMAPPFSMSQAVATATATQIATGMAQVPVGVISSADINANSAQLLATYSNIEKKLNLWGVDVAFNLLLADRWSLTGSASYMSEDFFTTERGQNLALNAPKRKGTVGVAYRDPEESGFDFEVRGRFSSEFPASSGVYEGIRCRLATPGPGVQDCVKAYSLVDLTAGYRLPGVRRVTVQGTVQNLFDDEYRSFPGVPAVGRLALIRLRVDL